VKTIRVSAAILNQTPLDWFGNEKRIREAISLAKQDSTTLLCLPELCITGYGCEDAFHSVGVQQNALDMLERLLPATNGMIVCLGLPLLSHNALFNTVCLVADGKILGFVAKRFLAGDGIHYEPRWFKPWPQSVENRITIKDQTYPLGDLYFDVGGIRIGFEICEDAWVAARPGAQLALKGIDLILNPSASHFAFGKIRIRERFVLEGSRAFNATYIYSNLVGNESGRAIYDGGALIASNGNLLAQGPRFSFHDVSITSAVVNIDATRISQSRSASYRPQIEDQSEGLVTAQFLWPTLAEISSTKNKLPAWEAGPSLKEEEFTRAVALGLFDYVRKSKSSGFVVSLSGGADSAAVSCLVSQALRLAVIEIGSESVREKLAFLRKVEEPNWSAKLLTCVYQASDNSSETTRNAAEQLAKALKAQYFEFNVSRLVQDYTLMIGKSLGCELKWESDDIALQNIQARVRSPGIWMVANLQNSLLLSTSNRSEAAVGYATMDGDTSGGLSPIAGIDKAFLRQWLNWVEIQGPEGLGPSPALAFVNKQAPTAELRPLAEKQTDEDDLMPYPLLDAIEKAAIRDKQAPDEVFHRMQMEFPQYGRTQLGLWVIRFFRLWCRNQWKRERYAPSFHVDDENLDPKTWCRFPILSGGYEKELAELEVGINSVST
jgi:NAD+ synthase (glutamine-hydrolysing)